MNALECTTIVALNFVAQPGKDNNIDFLSVHILLKLKLMNLRGVVPIWGINSLSHLWSGD